MTQKEQLRESLLDQSVQQAEEVKSDLFVDMAELKFLVDMQKDLELAQAKAEILAHKVQNVRLQLQLKYSLKDTDQIEGSTGKIIRK